MKSEGKITRFNEKQAAFKWNRQASWLLDFVLIQKRFHAKQEFITFSEAAMRTVRHGLQRLWFNRTAIEVFGVGIRNSAITLAVH